MANPIENWLYKGATNPRSYYANMHLWDALKMDTGEGWSSRYKGPGKSSWPKYMYEGIKSLTPWGSNVGNISGGTTGSRALYERVARGLPYIKQGAKFIKRTPLWGAVSDVLFGTDITASSVRDINKLLGVDTSPTVNQGGGGGRRLASPVSQPSYTPTVHSGESSWQPTQSSWPPTPSATPPPQRDYTAHVKSGAYGLRRGGIASLCRR